MKGKYLDIIVITMNSLILKGRKILISESHYRSNINFFKRHIQLDTVFVVDVL